jgi:putative FmdB family regulatory protein
MPMYEYQCQECGSQFSLLRRMSQSDSDIVCTQCGAPQIQRLFSVFAAHSKESNGAVSSLAGDSCSGGTCGMGSCSSGMCGCG